MRITRYPIPMGTARNSVGGLFTIEMGGFSRILSVMVNPSGTPMIYAEEAGATLADRRFRLLMTEQSTPDFEGRYVGSFMVGAATHHLYELP